MNLADIHSKYIVLDIYADFDVGDELAVLFHPFVRFLRRPLAVRVRC